MDMISKYPLGSTTNKEVQRNNKNNKENSISQLLAEYQTRSQSHKNLKCNRQNDNKV